MTKTQPEVQTVREHLNELRKRLFWLVASFGIGAVPGLIWSHQITTWLVAPLGQQLYFTTPAGGLNFVLQIAIITGLLAAVPALVYQGTQFVRPVNDAIGRNTAIKVMVTASVLAICGVMYAYVLSLPSALHFLTDFAGDNVKPLLTASDYLNFVMTYLLGSALIFQVPLIMGFINRIKPLKPGAIKRSQRWVIAGAVVFAGVITPTPDPYNQMMIALPLIVLFEISAFWVWARRPREKRTVSAPEIIREQPQGQFAVLPDHFEAAPQKGSLAFMPATTLLDHEIDIDLARALDLLTESDEASHTEPELVAAAYIPPRPIAQSQLMVANLVTGPGVVQPLDQAKRIDRRHVQVHKQPVANQPSGIYKKQLPLNRRPFFEDISPPMTPLAW